MSGEFRKPITKAETLDIARKFASANAYATDDDIKFVERNNCWLITFIIDETPILGVWVNSETGEPRFQVIQ